MFIWRWTERLVASGREEEEPDCAVEHCLQRRVAAVMEEIERNLIERLANTTIADVSDAEELTDDDAHRH